MEGLYGLADANQDLKVSSSEIRRYPKVAPLAQSPQVIGRNLEVFATVVPPLLEVIKNAKTTVNEKAVASESPEGECLVVKDSMVLKNYQILN